MAVDKQTGSGVQMRDNAAQIALNIAQLTKAVVLVGVPDTAAGRKPDPLDPGAPPISNAVIGYILEHGSTKQNIPPRPFLVPGVQGVLPQIYDRLRAGAKAVLRGSATAAEQTLQGVGLLAQAAVRRYMTTAQFAPLAEATLAERRRRARAIGRYKKNKFGHTVLVWSDKPLIDTGQLRQAINYVIRRRNAAGKPE